MLSDEKIKELESKYGPHNFCYQCGNPDLIGESPAYCDKCGSSDEDE
jgi:hypothetical protein